MSLVCVIRRCGDYYFVSDNSVCLFIFLSGCIVSIHVLSVLHLSPLAGLLYKSERKSEAYKGIGLQETESTNFGRSLKDIGYSLKIILLNPIWIVNTIVSIVVSGIIVAFAVFLPKLMETQFSLSAGRAAAIAGKHNHILLFGNYLEIIQ